MSDHATISPAERRAIAGTTVGLSGFRYHNKAIYTDPVKAASLKFDYVKLGLNGLVFYNKAPHRAERHFEIERTKQNENLTPGLDKTNGYLSAASSKKIRTIIETWSEAKAAAMKRYGRRNFFNFITLTLPADQGQDSDIHIKRNCLNRVTQYISREHGAKYVWKAEAQANGNIHFHIVTDKFIPWQNLTRVWVDSLTRHTSVMLRYYEKHSEEPRNCVDVDQVRDIEGVARYGAKYMEKTEKDKRGIRGKLWGCSARLRACGSFTVNKDVRPDLFFELTQRASSALHAADMDVTDDEYFCFIPVNRQDVIDRSRKLRDFYAQKLRKLYNFLQSDKPNLHALVDIYQEQFPLLKQNYAGASYRGALIPALEYCKLNNIRNLAFLKVDQVCAIE